MLKKLKYGKNIGKVMLKRKVVLKMSEKKISRFKYMMQ